MQESGSRAAPRLVANRYRLGTMSGRGGMGMVWQATDELIGRPVAVKELRPPAGLSADERAVITRRALPEERVRTLGVRILAALAAAHKIGVVHRDVKPGNIMVLPGDEVKLIDFGIAHAMDETRLTRDGIMGSTGYMAPESFHGKDPSPTFDLWSAGATLCHAITGHGPFDRDSTAATLHAILYDELPALPCRPPLSTVITGLLTRDIEGRMTSRQARDLLGSVPTEESIMDGQDARGHVARCGR